MVRAHYGVDLHREWARIVFGAGGHVVPEAPAGTYGMAEIMAPGTGTVQEIPSQAEILALDGVVSGRPFVGPGYELAEPTKASDVHVGEVVVRGMTEESVINRLYEVRDWFWERLRLAH
jgi:hypothetical protein